METRIMIDYKPSQNQHTFGIFSLEFKGYDGQVRVIRLKFDPKSLWAFAQDVTSVAFDFLILSMIVYNVDRSINRQQYSDDGWRRNIVLLNVPVLNLSQMIKASNALNKAISFLTGDSWDIHFCQGQPYNYAPKKNIAYYNKREYSKVALFSGGLDSLIGFIDEAASLHDGSKLLLISHMDLGKEHSDQKHILNYCQENNIYSGKYSQLLLNAGLKANSWNIKGTTSESTFRSRSLLFFAAGIYAAFNINPTMPLIVPENGTISINIPLDKGRRSSCSTRTTHPTFINLLEQALNILNIKNGLINPYRLKSKADMMIECFQSPQKAMILKSLYKFSCSCAKRGHNSFWDKSNVEIHNNNITHCGMCLPCLYRRVALDAVGLDTPQQYGTDILHGTKYDLNNKNQKRNRDFRSLLYFLKNRANKKTIQLELLMNGVDSENDLENYTSLAMHSYEQVGAWIDKYAPNDIKNKLK